MANPAEECKPKPDVSLHDLIARFKLDEYDISGGVEHLYDIALCSGETLPVVPIQSLDDLESFLQGKCPHRYCKNPSSLDDNLEFSSTDPFPNAPSIFSNFMWTNSDNYYSTDEAIFLIVQPASNRNTSNGSAPFVSLAHHNFTVYSGLRGHKLTAPTPKNTLRVKKGRTAVPFSIITAFEDDYSLLDRSGLSSTSTLENDNEWEQGFIEEIAKTRSYYKLSEEDAIRVFVPLERDKKTIARGWSIYAIPNQPSLFSSPILGMLEESKQPSEEGVISANYVSFEIPPEQKIALAGTVAIGTVIAALVVAYGYSTMTESELINQIRHIAPFIFGGLCCFGPMTTVVAAYFLSEFFDRNY